MSYELLRREVRLLREALADARKLFDDDYGRNFDRNRLIALQAQALKVAQLAIRAAKAELIRLSGKTICVLLLLAIMTGCASPHHQCRLDLKSLEQRVDQLEAPKEPPEVHSFVWAFFIFVVSRLRK